MSRDLSSSISARFLVENFSYKTGPNAKTTYFDDGTVYKRRKYTNAPANMSGSLFVSSSEALIFRSFYKDTLEEGTLDFYFINPLTKLNTKMIFISDPVFQAKSADRFLISMNVKVVESDTI